MARRIVEGNIHPVGYVQSSSFSSAAALPTIPASANIALIVVEDQTVRWRDDGSDPTSSVGMVWNLNTEYMYTGDLSTIKIIQTAATAKLNISYYSS